MVKMLKYLFAIDKKPQRGLIAAEWAMMAYLVLTLLYMFFTWTKLPSPEPMLWGRVRIVITTAALWGVYRMVPCRFTMFCRVALQPSQYAQLKSADGICECPYCHRILFVDEGEGEEEE